MGSSQSNTGTHRRISNTIPQIKNIKTRNSSDAPQISGGIYNRHDSAHK